jgi:hypothetical protein
MNPLRILAGVYAVLFAVVTSLNYVPGLTDATIVFFRVFGTLYCLDGLVGLATGSGYLDLGIFLHGVLDYPLVTKVLMNLPHIVIGGLAAFTGFVLARAWAPLAAIRA